jgi:hypothetical protein
MVFCAGGDVDDARRRKARYSGVQRDDIVPMRLFSSPVEVRVCPKAYDLHVFVVRLFGLRLSDGCKKCGQAQVSLQFMVRCTNSTCAANEQYGVGL